MPPQEPVQSPKNKNSIIIGMLAVLVILAAYIAFFKKGNDEIKNNEVVTPTGQTQTNQNPTGADYQPNQNTTPENPTTTTPAVNSYNDHGYSFSYSTTSTIRSGSIPGGYYAELTAPGDFVSVKFYPGALPSTYNSAFFTQSTMINGKTFKYGDVQTGGGVSRTYQYQKNGKTITIQLSHTTSTLIDLGSIEIN